MSYAKVFCPCLGQVRMEEIKEKFSLLYDQYIQKIYRFVYLKVSSQETAEDLCSDIFTRIWERCLQNQGVPLEHAQAFIYQVARNVVVDYYRERGKLEIFSVEQTIGEVVDLTNSFAKEAAQKIEIERIRKVIAMLKDEYQDYLIWYYLEGVSVPEMAQITGKSEENVRVGVHRAVQALKGKLELREEVKV